MRFKKLNKTQLELTELLVNRPHFLKNKHLKLSKGSNGNPMLSIQHGRYIDQGIALSERFPEIFESKLIGFSLVYLFLRDEIQARKLLDYQLIGA